MSNSSILAGIASHYMVKNLGMKNAIFETHPSDYDDSKHKTWNAERSSYHRNKPYGPGQLLDYILFKSNRKGVEVSVTEYSSPDIRWDNGGTKKSFSDHEAVMATLVVKSEGVVPPRPTTTTKKTTTTTTTSHGPGRRETPSSVSEDGVRPPKPSPPPTGGKGAGRVAAKVHKSLQHVAILLLIWEIPSTIKI